MPTKKVTQTKKNPAKKKPAKVQQIKEPKKTYGNGFGVTGLVFGILSLLCIPLLAPLGIFFGLFGIIFSTVQQRRTPTQIGTAGLVTSSIGLVFSVLFTALLIITIIMAKELVSTGFAGLNSLFGNLPLDQLKNLQELKDLIPQLPTNLSY